ncbi:MAG TPA: peptidoglycan-binding domain-containing protein, partial [Candidatus Omnitrophota bacterium]|nr:peptidoglycan-binding domain-containing protein [Candidatus Omnitrophota bacterium]
SSNTEERITQIQTALKKAGFYKGEVDGRLGPQTRKAIRAFQKENGLKPDSVVGLKTWEDLKEYLKN